MEYIINISTYSHATRYYQFLKVISYSFSLTNKARNEEMKHSGEQIKKLTSYGEIYLVKST